MVIKWKTSGQFHAVRGVFARSQCSLIALVASSMQEKVFV